MLDDLRNPFFAEIAGGHRGARLRARLPGAARRRRAPGPAGARRRWPRCSSTASTGSSWSARACATADIAAAAAEVPVVMVGRQVARGRRRPGHHRREPWAPSWCSTTSSGWATSGSPTSTAARARAGPSAGRRSCAGCARTRLGARARVIPGDFTEEAGAAAARALLAEPELPTAVFAANDMVAAGLLGGFDQAGVEVPGDVSIVGYDNNFIAHLAHVVADHRRPAAHRDGADGARAAAGPHRQPAGQRGAPGGAVAGGPLHHRASAGLSGRGDRAAPPEPRG